jgi:phosphoribosylamine--glycine ligase
MRILVVGSGAREHALAWKLAQDDEVICAPGNPGIAEDVECVPVMASDAAGLLDLCRARSVDLVVVGPEDPLVAGLADHLRAGGVAVYGPGRDGAQLEASKAFAKDLMQSAGIPTAAFQTFTDAKSAMEYVRVRFEQGRGVAVKASGNALGKGVVVCPSIAEAEDSISRMMVLREFGEAGATVVIEDCLSGPEFSLITLVGDQNFVSLPVAQDYKRALDGDRGANTGGMGSFSPVGWLPDGLVEQVEQSVIAPLLKQLRQRDIAFRGTLFSGLMMDDGDPYCLEYNVRFGDPETESLMLRLGKGLGRSLHQAATGARIEAPEVLPNAAVSVFVASGGYPESYGKGYPIEIGAVPSGAKLFHAGTTRQDGRLVTSGGRVICASASAASLDDAKALAYQAAEAIRFEGAFYRRDVAAGTLT